MAVLSCSKNNCLKIKWHLELAKLMTWGDPHGGVVQLQPSSRLQGRHSKAHCSHKAGENKTWIRSLFFLHILSHIYSISNTLRMLVRIFKNIYLERQIDPIYGICHSFSWFFSHCLSFFLMYRIPHAPISYILGKKCQRCLKVQNSVKRGDFIVLVLLSAHIERFCVSRMRDLLLVLG